VSAIQGIAGLPGAALPDKVAPTSDGADFGAALGDALGAAGKAEKNADAAAAQFASGDPQIGIHEVMIAAEKANISVRYAVTLKNKMIEAYRELMSTQL
jgi:flagellar hook-basal body complex protein FliE